jgi:hypothetical protein
MTLTAALMENIQSWTEIADRCLGDAVRAMRAESLAEVTHGMASSQWRIARKDYARAIAAIRTAEAERGYLQERLARACDPWFWVQT